MSIYQDHKPNSGSGDYLKLKDGDRVKVRFASEPAVVTYDGKKLRYQWVVYNKTSKLAQIYEAGPQVFGQLAELYDEWGEPTEFDVTIGRTGSGQFDTSYSVSPSPKSVDLTPEEQAKVEAVKFPGEKSRMLADLQEDGQMPETIPTKAKLDKVHEVVEGEPMNLDELPPDFLT